MPPRKREPNLKFNGQIATLTTSAESILTQQNETHVAVIRTPDGRICLKPILVDGLVDIVKIHKYADKRKGAPRLHLGCLSDDLKPGRYAIAWDSAAGVACLSKMEDEEAA